MSKSGKKTGILTKLFGKEKDSYFNSAIIVAAGTGKRMNSDKTKQLMEICQMPIIARTVRQFEKCPHINEIILVCRKDEFAEIGEIIKKYKFKKITHVISGGQTRQQSVLNGLSVVDKQSEFVSIHDGARCLVTPEMISEVCKAAYRFGGATACCCAKDTIKICDKGGFIAGESIDRNVIRHAQTPQIFRTDIYRAAAFSAKEEGFDATDDNSLVTRIGFKVFLCDTGHENIKITTPEDIRIAEGILKHRKETK